MSTWMNLVGNDLDRLATLPTSNERGFPSVATKTFEAASADGGTVKPLVILDALLSGLAESLVLLSTAEAKGLTLKISHIFSAVIQRFGGSVGIFSETHVTAFFGFPQASENDVELAVRCSFEMDAKLSQLQVLLRRHEKLPDVTLGLHVGIHADKTFVTGLQSESPAEIAFEAYLKSPAATLVKNLHRNRGSLEVVRVTASVKQSLGDGFSIRTAMLIETEVPDKKLEAFVVEPYEAHPQTERWHRNPVLRHGKYIGRDEELSTLLNIFNRHKTEPDDGKPANQTANQNPVVVVGISGETGMGKSRLVYEFSKMAAIEKSLVKAHALAYEAGGSFHIWTQFVRHYINARETDDPKLQKKKLDAAYTRLINSLKTDSEKTNFGQTKPVIGYLLGIDYADNRVQLLDAGALQTEIKLSVRYFLETIAIATFQDHHAPLVVVMEDIDHADDSSLEILNFVLSTLNTEEKKAGRRQSKLLFLMLYSPSFSLLRAVPDVERLADFHEIFLTPLGKPQAKAIIDSMTGGLEMTTGLFDKLFERSLGNPFFIEEWLINLAERKAIVKENARLKLKEGAAIAIPMSLQSLILSRIDVLGGNARRLLQQASVIGIEFSFDVLLVLKHRVSSESESSNPSEMTESEMLALLKALEKADFITHEPKSHTYAFKHGLIQTVTYNLLVESERTRLHRQVAESLEEIAGRLKLTKKSTGYSSVSMAEEFAEQLAYHYLNAKTYDKAALYSLRAAQKARRDSRNREAEQYLADTLSLLDTGNVWNARQIRYEVLCEQELLFRTLGRLTERYETLTALKTMSEEIFNETGDDSKLLDALKREAIYWNNASNFQRSIEINEAIAARAEAQGEKALLADSLNNLGTSNLFLGNYEKTLRLWQRSYQLRQELSDKRGIAVGANNLGAVYHEMSQHQKALQYFTESLALFEDIGDRNIIAATLSNFARIYRELAEYEKSMDYCLQALDLLESLGDKTGIAIGLNVMGWINYSFGNYTATLESSQRALKLREEIGDPRTIADSLLVVSASRRMLGDIHSAFAVCERAVRLKEQINDRRGLSNALREMGNLHYANGDYDKALTDYSGSLEIIKDIGFKFIRPLLLFKLAQTHLSMMVQAEKANDFSPVNAKLAIYHSLEAIKHLAGRGKGSDGEGQIWFGHYTILRTLQGKPDVMIPATPTAAESLHNAKTWVADTAAKISNPPLRESFLNIPVHRAITDEPMP
jgi:predicted ATPase